MWLEQSCYEKSLVADLYRQNFDLPARGSAMQLMLSSSQVQQRFAAYCSLAVVGSYIKFDLRSRRYWGRCERDELIWPCPCRFLRTFFVPVAPPIIQFGFVPLPFITDFDRSRPTCFTGADIVEVRLAIRGGHRLPIWMKRVVVHVSDSEIVRTSVESLGDEAIRTSAPTTGLPVISKKEWNQRVARSKEV